MSEMSRTMDSIAGLPHSLTKIRYRERIDRVNSVLIMKEWMKTLIDFLTYFDQPQTLKDIKRVVGIPEYDPDDKILFSALADIKDRVVDAGLKLVIEDAWCGKCERSISFSRNFSYKCPYCNAESVIPPKFCINRRDQFG